jgi:hypothetical protein
VGFRRKNIEFAAIGLEKHFGRLAGENQIGEQNAAAKIHDGETALRAAEYEGQRIVGEDEDVLGLGDNADGIAKSERGGVVDFERSAAAVNDENSLAVRRNPR